jgi:hypothetical protein
MLSMKVTAKPFSSEWVILWKYIQSYEHLKTLYMSCTNSKNLTRKNDFSTAYGLDTSFDGIQTFHIVFCSDKAWLLLIGYINIQDSRILSAEESIINSFPFWKLNKTAVSSRLGNIAYSKFSNADVV